MKYISMIVSLIKSVMVGIGLFMVRKSGKDAAEKDQAEAVIKGTEDAKKIHDAVDSDDEFNDGVSERFRR